MVYLYNNTVRGFNHIKNNTLCQDYSESYDKKGFQIVTCCDGHGSKIHFRSDIGSKLASNVVIDILKDYNIKDIVNLQENNNYDKLKLDILCRWNNEVERHLEENPFDDLNYLNEHQRFRVKNNPAIAYGTTLNCVMKYLDKLLCIQIGDGGIFTVKDGKINNVFPENDKNVANITCSLCSDDAYSDLYIKVINANEYDGVFLFTDGVLVPYGTFLNIEKNLINVIEDIIKYETKEGVDQILNEYIVALGEKDGSGDDVSLGIIYYK